MSDTNFLDHKVQNQQIQKSLQDSITNMFPVEQDGKKLILSNLQIEDTLGETDFPGQKETRLNRGS
jgi:hypothetical protein